MRIIESYTELAALPAGTVFCDTDDRKDDPTGYSDSLRVKGETISFTEGGGFCFRSAELMPQPLHERDPDTREKVEGRTTSKDRVLRIRADVLGFHAPWWGTDWDHREDKGYSQPRFYIFERADLDILIDVLMKAKAVSS